MVSPDSLKAPPCPELSDRLLAAVAERDWALTNRLLQQWVHRRGLVSLETWILGPLRSSQGLEAEAWLRHCLGRSEADSLAVIEQPLPMALVSEAADCQGSDRLDLPDSTDSPRSNPEVFDSPAPTPASLAALRAWLPDRSEDLPSAC